MNARDLILSTTCIIDHSLPLNNMLFLSFQSSHTVENQMTGKIERRALAAPPTKLN